MSATVDIDSEQKVVVRALIRYQTVVGGSLLITTLSA